MPLIHLCRLIRSITLLGFYHWISVHIIEAAVQTAAAVAPSITHIAPTSLPPASLTWVTLYGTQFGTSPSDLLDITLKSTDTTKSTTDEYRCTNIQWIDSGTARCVPPSSLPASDAYSLMINVSHALSPRTTAQDAILHIDCYASGSMCGACYQTLPSGAAYESINEGSLGMSKTTLLALLILGGIFTLLCIIITFAYFLTGGRKSIGGGRKVAQLPLTSIKASGGAEGMKVTVDNTVAAIVVTDDAAAKVEKEEDDDDDDIDIAIPSGVMISYSHANTPFALQLEAALVAAGFTVWIDTKITPGEDWRSNIAEAIELSFAVVAVLSPTSVTSKYCKEEIYYAAQTRRAVFPVVHLDCWTSLKGGLKMLLQRIQWLQFERDSWEVCFPKLVENLHAAYASQLASAKKKAAKKRRGMESRTDVYSFTSRGGGGGMTLDPIAPAEHGEDDDGSDIDDDDLDPAARSAAAAAAAGTRMRLPELIPGPSVVSVDQPGDVYICVDTNARSDYMVSCSIRDYLQEHGLIVYTSQRPPPVKRRKGHALMQSDGRASPGPSMPGSPVISRRPSVVRSMLNQQSEGAGDQSSQQPAERQLGLLGALGNKPRAASIAAILADEGVESSSGGGGDSDSGPPSGFTRRRQRSIFQAPSADDGSGGAGAEDCFEANASHIDVSTMMIFIASAISFKSVDCTDELHYAYEMSKPMLQIRTDSQGREFHSGLLHGSIGMMLQQVPSVHWEADGQPYTQLTSHFYVLKYKIQAERARKKAESTRNKRKTMKSLNGKSLVSPRNALTSPKNAQPLTSPRAQKIQKSPTSDNTGGVDALAKALAANGEKFDDSAYVMSLAGDGGDKDRTQQPLPGSISSTGTTRATPSSANSLAASVDPSPAQSRKASTAPAVSAVVVVAPQPVKTILLKPNLPPQPVARTPKDFELVFPKSQDVSGLTMESGSEDSNTNAAAAAVPASNPTATMEGIVASASTSALPVTTSSPVGPVPSGPFLSSLIVTSNSINTIPTHPPPIQTQSGGLGSGSSQPSSSNHSPVAAPLNHRPLGISKAPLQQQQPSVHRRTASQARVASSRVPVDSPVRRQQQEYANSSRTGTPSPGNFIQPSQAIEGDQLELTSAPLALNPAAQELQSLLVAPANATSASTNTASTTQSQLTQQSQQQPQQQQRQPGQLVTGPAVGLSVNVPPDLHRPPSDPARIAAAMAHVPITLASQAATRDPSPPFVPPQVNAVTMMNGFVHHRHEHVSILHSAMSFGPQSELSHQGMSGFPNNPMTPTSTFLQCATSPSNYDSNMHDGLSISGSPTNAYQQPEMSPTGQLQPMRTATNSTFLLSKVPHQPKSH